MPHARTRPPAPGRSSRAGPGRSPRLRAGSGRTIAAAVILLSVATSCSRASNEDPTATPDPAATAEPTVTVDTSVSRVVTAEGSLVLSVPPQQLAAPGAGRVTEVVAAPGQQVAEGALLVRIDEGTLQSAVADAKSALAAAEEELLGLRNDTRADTARAELGAAEAALRRLDDKVEIRRLADELERAKNNRWSAQASRDSTCGMADAGLAEQASCDSAQAAVQSAEDGVRIAAAALAAAEAAYDDDLAAARAQAEAARGAYSQVAGGPSTLELEAAAARRDKARRDVALAEETLESGGLTAPFAGEVDAVHVAPGVEVAPGGPLVTLAMTRPLQFVTTNLSERNVGLVRRGAGATVTLTAFPDSPLSGTVDRVSSRAEESAGAPSFAVYIELDLPDDLPARAGMTGRAEIETE